VNNTSVTLNIKYNCDKEWEKTINVNTASIVLVPADVDATDFLPDGIYSFKITTVDQADDTFIETSCVFVNCVTTCNMLESYKNHDCDRTTAFFALLASKDCPNCSCEDLCLLYNIATLNPCEDVKPCGCK
jgi:hypothetical protein